MQGEVVVEGGGGRQAVAPQQMSMGRGIEWTAGAEGLYVAQRLELNETLFGNTLGCESRNR